MSSPEERGELQVIPTPQLISEINDMPGEVSCVLLDSRGLPGAIEAVRSEATAVNNGVFERLHLTTHIELTDHETDARVILEALESGFMKQRPHDDLSLDSRYDYFYVKDEIAGDVSSVISAIMRGQRGWQVQSILENFRHEGLDSATDRAGVEAVVAQHTFAVSSLMSVLRAGDDINHANLMLTMSREHSGLETFAVEPERPLDKFIGLDLEIEELREVVMFANASQDMLQRANIRPVQAIMLHGPSGVGKSAIMHAFVEELEAEMVAPSFSDVSGGYVAEWANKLEKVFADAFSSDQRTVIVLDEMDGLVLTGNAGVTSNVNSVLKRNLDLLKDHPHVFLIAATNHIHLLAPEIIADKRIPLKLGIPLPEEKQREDLFRSLIVGPHFARLGDIEEVDKFVELEVQSSQFNFQQFAAQTEGFSGGDIEEIVNRINRGLLRDAFKAGQTTFGLPAPEQVYAAITRARRNRPQA